MRRELMEKSVHGRGAGIALPATTMRLQHKARG
jgi:hypothetical protein